MLKDVSELKKQYGIGLTGGIATGKSTVARILVESGSLVIDADQLSRQIMQPGTSGYQKILAAFGTVDRNQLAEIIFSNPAKKKQLEAITHPLIQDLLNQTLKNSALMHTPKIWFYEASLIFENQIDEQLLEVWATYCKRETQLRRLMEQRKMPKDLAEKILAAQMPAAKKAALAREKINTDVDLPVLREGVLRLLKNRVDAKRQS